MTQYNPQNLQRKFEQWHELHKKLSAAQKQWQEAEKLYAELTAYYESPQWIADREQNIELQYSGEVHSILSEDALWEMISERNEMALKWIRLGLESLEKR